MSATHADRPIIVATILHEHGPTGVQAHFNAFKDHMLAHGRQVQVVTPFCAQKALVYPVFGARYVIDRVNGDASVWWYRHWHYVFLKTALRERLRDGKPAVVYAQCPLSAKAALEVRANAAQRVVMVAHFNISQANEWAEKGKIAHDSKLFRSIQQLEQTVLSRLDGIVYVSRFTQEQLQLRITGLKRIPAAVIPNFVQPAADCYDEGVRGDLISIGTLEPRKNQRYLLDVLLHAARMGHRYTLTLVGDGPDRGMLEQLARENGLSNQVSFLGNRKNAARFICNHRVYAHSASMESFGIVLIEALAAAVPVVAAPVGGIPEIFSAWQEGIFWPLDDPAEGARRLIDLLEQPDRLAAMSRAARQRYLTAFTPEIAANQLCEFLYADHITERVAL